jgi:methionyl-tRNA synthetase
MARFYVTTPIYYVNDVPHLGTSYTTIVVDALRRYHALRGHETRMLTGTDEHGEKIERAAKERGTDPLSFATQTSARFRELWPKLEIQADDFIRTTEKRHEDLAQALWRMVAENKDERGQGDIYLGDYEGLYCVGCEELKTEKELLPGNVCPLHNTPAERVKEPSYFFRLSRYEKRLLAYYEQHPYFIEPESRRNEVMSFVRGGLRDLSVSRTSFTWGVPVPGDPKHVMYVWFDALANYWTAVQDTAEHKRFWDDATVVHVVGKDILRFHAVYWPAFLMSAGLPLPAKIYAHGFLTFNGQKMSKSLRNSVEPFGIARAFGGIAGSDAAGADVLRYQLLRAIAFGQDGDFDLASMIERYNADLGKNLGNLLARTLGLCAKLTGGKVPAATPTPLEVDLLTKAKKAALAARDEWDAIAPHRALERAWALSSDANQYVDRAAPWAEAKKGDQTRVDTILATLLEVLQVLSVLVWPALPKKSDEMRAQLGLPPVSPRAGHDGWPDGAEPRPAGAALAPGAPLFPTIDEAGARALLDALTPRIVDTNGGPASPGTAPAQTPATAPAQAPATAPAPGGITYDHFSTVDLRVGVVRTAERVPKKDKLLRLLVDLGEPEPRTIVAGLALSFTPEQLVGRRVIVVANLAPREFGKGLVSHGMLLASGPSEKLTLATVDGDLEPGAKLK